jgi:hypothetical protein
MNGNVSLPIGSTASPATSGNAAVGNNPMTSQFPGQTSNGNALNAGSRPGTNAAGTAASSGGNAQNSAPAGGIGRPTTTNERDSDAKIDQENEKADKTVGKICKNC